MPTPTLKGGPWTADPPTQAIIIRGGGVSQPLPHPPEGRGTHPEPPALPYQIPEKRCILCPHLRPRRTSACPRTSGSCMCLGHRTGDPKTASSPAMPVPMPVLPPATQRADLQERTTRYAARATPDLRTRARASRGTRAIGGTHRHHSNSRAKARTLGTWQIKHKACSMPRGATVERSCGRAEPARPPATPARWRLCAESSGEQTDTQAPPGTASQGRLSNPPPTDSCSCPHPRSLPTSVPRDGSGGGPFVTHDLCGRGWRGMGDT